MKSIILFSGGVDSTVLLAKALQEGKECLALSFDYGQRHRIELEAAKKIVKHYAIQQKIIQIDPSAFATTSLVAKSVVPKYSSQEAHHLTTIPTTQVPARNTLFIAYALGQAEIWDADEIHAGPNAHDHDPYPDCRPPFYAAYQQLAQYATKQAAQGKIPRILTPLIQMTKKEIVALGRKLNAPLDWTHSCYDPSPEGQACTQCLACQIRQAAW